MFSFIRDFLLDEDGLTVVEYVVGAGMLVGAIAIVYDAMGGQLSSKFESILSNV